MHISPTPHVCSNALLKSNTFHAFYQISKENLKILGVVWGSILKSSWAHMKAILAPPKTPGGPLASGELPGLPPGADLGPILGLLVNLRAYLASFRSQVVPCWPSWVFLKFVFDTLKLPGQNFKAFKATGAFRKGLPNPNGSFWVKLKPSLSSSVLLKGTFDIFKIVIFRRPYR